MDGQGTVPVCPLSHILGVGLAVGSWRVASVWISIYSNPFSNGQICFESPSAGVVFLLVSSSGVRAN